MATLVWDEAGKHNYVTGVDQVALFVKGSKPIVFGVAGGTGTASNTKKFFNHATTETPITIVAGTYYQDVVTGKLYKKATAVGAAETDVEEVNGLPDGVSKPGVAWSGVTAINENPSGAESTKLYADNKEYLNLLSKEEFGFSIEAYASPEEFDACDGMAGIVYADNPTTGKLGKIHAQTRAPFALAFRVLKGNDNQAASVDGNNYEYHIVYNCRAGVASLTHNTVNDSPDAGSFSWDITTIPETEMSDGATGAIGELIGDFAPTSHVIIDTIGTEEVENAIALIEKFLYGSATNTPVMVPPSKYDLVLGFDDWAASL